MSEPIYKLFITKPLTPIQISGDERKKIMEKMRGNLAELGGKEIVLCRAFGERWTNFGINEFPNIEAIKEREAYIRQGRQELGVVVDSLNLMGFKMRGDLEIDPDMPIIKAFLTNVRKHQHTDEARKKMGELRNECCKIVIACRSLYQDWAHFGIEQFPDIESVEKYHRMYFEYQRDANITWDDMTVLGYKVG